MTLTNQFFKKSLILFWTLWWIIALWTDVIGLLSHNGLLHATWAPDTNYPALSSSLQMYHVPIQWIDFLYIAIIVWLAFITLAFCWTSAALTSPTEIWMSRARTAFIISLGLWLSFFIGDQITMKFDFEENHMVQGGFELLSFLAMYILPDTTSDIKSSTQHILKKINANE